MSDQMVTAGYAILGMEPMKDVPGVQRHTAVWEGLAAYQNRAAEDGRRVMRRADNSNGPAADAARDYITAPHGVLSQHAEFSRQGYVTAGVMQTSGRLHDWVRSLEAAVVGAVGAGAILLLNPAVRAVIRARGLALVIRFRNWHRILLQQIGSIYRSLVNPADSAVIGCSC
ncbi:hypothetical protein AB0M44_10935 [Streptosporangium subroseum]|uniref:hypothetical protein n=1 Tax=Streptosporangium subroseum TaxID=106412 RepID=UPI0034263736